MKTIVIIAVCLVQVSGYLPGNYVDDSDNGYDDSGIKTTFHMPNPPGCGFPGCEHVPVHAPASSRGCSSFRGFSAFVYLLTTMAVVVVVVSVTTSVMVVMTI